MDVVVKSLTSSMQRRSTRSSSSSSSDGYQDVILPQAYELI